MIKVFLLYNTYSMLYLRKKYVSLAYMAYWCGNSEVLPLESPSVSVVISSEDPEPEPS